MTVADKVYSCWCFGLGFIMRRLRYRAVPSLALEAMPLHKAMAIPGILRFKLGCLTY